MYSRGMSMRDISATIDDIYGFKLSAEQISKITDFVLEEQKNWQNRKDILGLWKHFWMQIFDEIKSRGVQRCIFHLIRNSLKYVPTKDYKNFCADLKKIYGVPSLKTAQFEFERFCEKWKKYPGAVALCLKNFSHLIQLFDYPSAVRKIMYTTNAIEAVNSGFRKVTKRGAFSSDDSVFKIFYRRITEFYRKWADRPVAGWSLVRNQLLLDEHMSDFFAKFDR